MGGLGGGSAHQQQDAAQAMFERADMPGQQAEPATFQPSGRETFDTPQHAAQYKEQSVQQLPAAFWNASQSTPPNMGERRLCRVGDAMDHAGKFAGVCFPVG